MDGKGASQYGRSAGPYGLKGKARCSTEVVEVYGSRHGRRVRGVNQMDDEVGCRLRGQAIEVGATRRYERRYVEAEETCSSLCIDRFLCSSGAVEIAA